MSFGSVVDVAIGLVFVYLLLALVGSSLQEAISGWMNLRGRRLRLALVDLLGHPTGTVSGGSIFEKVFRHGLISPDATRRDPSYIPSENFRMALFASLSDGSRLPRFSQIEGTVAALPSGALRDSLTAMIVQAAGDMDTLSASVEKWFNNSMDRASGYYKRFANNFMLAFGIAAALVGNIDTVAIAIFLWNNPAQRAVVVEQAQKYSNSGTEGRSGADAGAASISSAAASDNAQYPGQFTSAVAQIKALPIPVGWPGATKWSWTALIGWTVTALAVSLGAPFWFDLLQKFLNIRNTGPPPKRPEDLT
jgi:hypothetical protein